MHEHTRGPDAAQSTYRCTFGTYTQGTPWTDVRPLSWPGLAALLTQHEVGPKEGTCVVPAVFSGLKRAKADAARIDVVFLDSDAGYTLEQIASAVTAVGWQAVISSTHSHLTTTTKIKRCNWDRYRAAATVDDMDDLPARYLIDEKGMLPAVADGATVVSETDEFTIFEHQPCPKFRVALPLLRPWLASNYDDQRGANAAWKERIEALAAALGLNHDQACTDTSRLFYLPRRAEHSPPAETAVIDGTQCDIFALSRAEPNPKAASARPGRTKGARAARQGGAIEFMDPSSGENIDLGTWAGRHGPRFQLVTALESRQPGVFLSRPGEGPKRHIRCVNEDAHTQAGADAATFVVNASDSTSKSGFVYHCRHGHCDGRDRLLFIRQMLEQRWLVAADLTNPTFLVSAEQVRPRIRVVGGEIANIVDQAETALVAAELGVYQRGTSIVRTGQVSIAISSDRAVAGQRILELGDHALVEALTTAANWEKYDGRSQSFVAIDAPLKVALTLKQRVGRWKLPIITGLINAPTLRDDGSIQATEGYDPASGLLFDFAGATFPTIPDRPTKDEANAALGLLSDLISGFSFVSEADKAVALSAILTASIRRSLKTAPLHAFTAPVAGSGKSKLVDIATMIACGREAGVIAPGKTDEETEKRLGSLLFAGDTVIAIDNCEAPLGGDFLCQMLTQPIVRARILGKSEAPELPSNAMVTATGNNLVLVGDMARRALLCQLDPQCERPELRVFDQDPIYVVRANRGAYLTAALTVLRAFHVAGRPKQSEPLGSFGSWSRWVRDSLIWLGQADSVTTLDRVRENDPKLDALTAVLTQWWEVIGSRRVSVQDIIEQATRTTPPTGLCFKPEMVNPGFREALLHVSGDGGMINGRRLSKWIGANESRLVTGFRIVRKCMLRGFMTWELEQRSQVNADAA